MITEEQIQAEVRRIVEGYAPDKIILFGAYAYGAPHEHSDLDLLLIKEKARVKRAVAIWTLLWGTAELLPMDILIRTPEELAKRSELYYTVEAQALQKGKSLYANT